MNESEKKTLKDSVIKVITDMKDGDTFSGLDLQKRVTVYYPKAKKKYTETILRVARKYCREQFRCIKRDKSIYEKIG